MVYQVKHNSFFMGFVHNFTSLKSVIDFIKSSSFQAVKEFEVITLPTKIEDLEIDSIELCKNGKWHLNNLVTAAVVEFDEIVKDFDIFEYRNNFDEDEILKMLETLSLSNLATKINLWMNSIEIEENQETEKKCKDLKKAILSIG